MVTVGPGFTCGTNGTEHSMANTVGGSVSTKYPKVPFTTLECTDAAHPLR